MSTIYSTNFQAAKEAANLLKNFHITRFHSQNVLYAFIEDIKNPFLTHRRNRFSKKGPVYRGNLNYDPIINYLEKHDVLIYKKKKVSNSGWTLQYEIEVDKDALDYFIERHKNLTKAI